MDNKKVFAICIGALLVGSSGLWISVATIIRFQVVEGPQGIKGDQGDQGIGAVGLVVVGFLDPDDGDIVRGNLNIKAIIGGTSNYTAELLCNGSLLSTSVPFIWDSSSVLDGWWNLTLKVQDLDTFNSASDTIMVFTLNHGPLEWYFPDYSTHPQNLEGVFNFTMDVPVTSWYYLEYNLWFQQAHVDDLSYENNLTAFILFEQYNGSEYVFHSQTMERYIFQNGAWSEDIFQPLTVSWMVKIEDGLYRIWIYLITSDVSSSHFRIREGSSVYMSILY